MKSHKEVTIIGAGPAGLSAAIQLSKYGVRSTIIDENPKIGGAIYKQPEKGLNTSLYRNEKTYKKAIALFEEFEKHKANVRLELESEVLGDFSLTGELGVLQRGKFRTISNEALIICAGCYERAQPFPGWTLPGIMSVGGIQLQVKCGSVKPGNKVALIGTGPLLLVAAKQLHMGGVEVVAVVESGKKKEIAKNALNLLANKKLLQEGIEYMRYLKKHKIPFYQGYGIVSAAGDERVEELTIAPYTDDWFPIKEKAFKIQVDCAGIGYGYIPRVQLTEMLTCEHTYEKSAGGVFPKLDKWQRTNIESIYTAGDNSGIYGADVAVLEGKLAALGYLIDIKEISEKEAEKIASPIYKEIHRLKKFQHTFEDYSGLKKGLMALPNADTIICRCENVKRNEIDKAISDGVKDLPSLKINTRVGMGDCQGKICGNFCKEYLAEKLDKLPENIQGLKPRFPMAAIPFESIIENE